MIGRSHKFLNSVQLTQLHPISSTKYDNKREMRGEEIMTKLTWYIVANTSM